jgi:ParB family chromosome partitioning protein
MEEFIAIKPVEIIHLELSYSHIRIENPRAVIRMADALATHGQVMPILVAPAEAPRYTLIDGYLRVAAARRLGKDTLVAHIFNGEEKEALCHVLMKSSERKWDIFEQAGLIRELHRRHELSQREIARLLGKDQSWVSRRLSLLEALPEQVMRSVKGGNISSWAASRVLRPMARANPDHARRLAAALMAHPFSTRELFDFFKHYQRSNRKVRENMIDEPALFVKARDVGKDLSEARELSQGPEGKFRQDLSIIGHMLNRLIRDVDTVIYPGQSNLDRRSLLSAFNDADQLWRELKMKIQRCTNDTDSRQRDDSIAAQSPSGHSSDQPTA